MFNISPIFAYDLEQTRYTSVTFKQKYGKWKLQPFILFKHGKFCLQFMIYV